MGYKISIKTTSIVIVAVFLIQACKDSSSGPEPEPEPPVELQITSIEPESGTTGTEVTITGTGFDPAASQNKVVFNGAEGSVENASETELLTIVPEGASTGPVDVTVGGETANGPEFEVITTGLLEIQISNNRTDLEPDGFDISANGEIKVKAESEGVTLLELDEGTYNIEMTDIINFCELTEDSDRSVDIVAGDTTIVTYNIECQAVLNDQIVYLKHVDSIPELFVMDSDGTNQLQLTENENGSSMPDISPDGTKIAFVRDEDIYVMDADGSNVTNLTTSPERDQDPDWSPTGTEIVFSRMAENNDREIATINTDGTGLTSLTDVTYDDYISPSWSPEGQHIIYLRLGLDWKIYIMDADGSNQQLLNENITASDAFDPTWSPDGEEIAFVGRVDEGIEIFIVDSDGTNERVITDKYPDIGNPLSWSPDGTKLLYYNMDSGMFKINTDGSEEVKLLENSGSTIHAHPDWGPPVE